MSRTPLTDAQAYDVGGDFHKDGAVVAAGFARHLEETREDARRELGIAQSRLASIFLSGALDDKLCGDIQKWAKDYTAEIERLKQNAEIECERANRLGSRLELTEIQLAAKRLEIEMLRAALSPLAALEVSSMGRVPDADQWLWKPSQTNRDLPGINVAHVKAAKAAFAGVDGAK